MEISDAVSACLSRVDRNSLVIFAGAGISVSSGIPAAHSIKSKILTALGASDSVKPSILNAEIPFELFMETLGEQGGIEALFGVFNSNIPNQYHFTIANLLVTNAISIVVTTNFDRLIEEALTQYGLVQGRDFDVVSSFEKQNSFDWNSDRRKIVKLHGCISKPEHLAITLSRVSSKENYKNISWPIGEIFRKSRFRSALIIGYSCSDHFDITPAFVGIGSEITDMYFISHLDVVGHTGKTEPATDAKSPLAFRKSKNGVITYAKTESVIAHLFGQPPTCHVLKGCLELNDLAGWEKAVEEWVSVVAHRESYRLYILARLLIRSNRFEQAYEILLTAAKSVSRDRKHEAAMIYQNIGIAAYRMGHAKCAIHWLQRGVRAAVRANSKKILGQLYGNLGNVHYSANRLALAEKYQSSCLSMARREKIRMLEANTYGNLGIIQEKRKLYAMARSFHFKAMRLAKKIGDPAGIARHQFNIALTYQLEGNLALSMRWVSRAMNESKLTGQEEVTANCHLIIGKILIKKEKALDAILHLLDAIRLFLAVGSRLNLRECYQCIASMYEKTGDSINASKFRALLSTSVIDP